MTDMIVGGKYRVEFDEASTAQLVLAGFQAGGWETGAVNALAGQGFSGVQLSNAQIVPSPVDPSGYRAAIDVDLTSATGPATASTDVVQVVLTVAAFLGAVAAAIFGAPIAAAALAIAAILILIHPPGSGPITVPGGAGTGFALGAGATVAIGVGVLYLASRAKKGAS